MTASNPKTTFTIVAANTVVENAEQKVLLVGQMISGTATPGALVTNIQNESSENDLFGRQSQLAEMVRAFKRINPVSRLDAIPLADNGSGVAATAAVTFTGTATASGTLYVSVGSSVNHRYQLDVSSGNTAATLATNLTALITADLSALMSAAAVSGACNLTALNDGTIANSYTIKVEGLVEGISVAITAPSAGATDPSVTSVFDVIDGLRYQTIVMPVQYGTSTLGTLLTSRFNVDNDVLDGIGVFTKIDTYANLVTLGGTLNNQSLIVLGNQTVSRTALKGGQIVEFDFCISAEFAAVRALRLTLDQNISQYVLGGESRDQFGGPALSTLPYFNTPFYNLPVIEQGDQFTSLEIDALNAAGISVLLNNIANNQLIAGQIVTTYKTDAGGNPDLSYKYLNYVDTISNIREYMFNNAKSDFRQARLTQGDLVPNRRMFNQAGIEAVFDGYYLALSGPDFVLVQAGEGAMQYFKENRSASIDLSQGQVTMNMVVPIVTQLREILATLKISFSTDS